MEFRDLRKQYQVLKAEIDAAVESVMKTTNFISGKQVTELEESLADYVGVKHCITCANGTDALSLVLAAWGIGPGDAVFVPDFTFFATAEVVSFAGATPVLVDVYEDTFNIDCEKLEEAIKRVRKEGKLNPKAIIPVDLFGQPADYNKLEKIAKENDLLILEDGAQGFGGAIGDQKACSFGNAATTSFFPAKPLGCYGDGGAVFTNDDNLAELVRSLSVHGKGSFKYDNVRIGMNSRLDTIQAAILQIKFKAFQEYELEDVNRAANSYTERLKNEDIALPLIAGPFYSSWAQYVIRLKSEEERTGLQNCLKENGIPSMVYYPKPMHLQSAMSKLDNRVEQLKMSEQLSKTVLALPIHPYLTEEDVELVTGKIKMYLANLR